ncbi:Uncharacterised protein [uncultured archaeon]|nr:Uncharacterised protein [uncultured archaeon]
MNKRRGVVDKIIIQGINIKSSYPVPEICNTRLQGMVAGFFPDHNRVPVQVF